MAEVGFITLYAIAETMAGLAHSQRRKGSAMGNTVVLATGG
jgi:hypothetical protein